MSNSTTTMSYCQQCLVRMVIQDQQGKPILTCPNCLQVTPISASRVADLHQAAFQITQLLEEQKIEEQKNISETTASTGSVESVSTSPTGHRNTTVGCPEHSGKEAIFYCETCGITICIKCTKKGSKHIGHDYYDLDEAFERYKEEIASFLDPIEKQLVTIETALAQLDTRYEEISNQQAIMEVNINDAIARLHQTLDVRKTELIGQLHRLTQDKLKSLTVQRNQIEHTETQLSSCLHLMRENFKTDDHGGALLMKSTTVRQVKELTTTFQPDLLEPNTEADMTFSASADITTMIQNYGLVHKQGPPDPSKCTATGKGVEEAVVGEKSTVLLQTLKIEDLNSITCELVSEMTGTRVGGSVARRGQSQYEISYQPTIKGRHQLHIKVEDQHIRGSPFPVTARSLVEELGTPILTISGLKTPAAVAINQKGEVVVTEVDGNCVSVFSPSGKKLVSFGSCGTDEEYFQNPCGVAVDDEGCILVTDEGNHRIQKFTAKGQLLIAVGSECSLPRGIAYNACNGKVYVVDEKCHVQILDSDLNVAGSFGEQGSDSGAFDDPQHLACDSTGNVYVADYGKHCIQVFTAEGEFLRMLGCCEKSGGRLKKPVGLAIDSSDRVYVADWHHHHVSVFTSEGHFVTSFGRQGSKPGQFFNPAGLAVDSSGVVYVCDSEHNRIQVF